MRRKKCEPDDVAAAEHHLSFPLRRQPDNPALPAERCRHVEIPLAIERQPLWPAQPPKEHTHFPGGRNPVYALEARCGWPRDEKLPRRTECQVIRRKRRLQRRKNENLAVRPNLENRSAPVSDIKAPRFIERDSRRCAHALNPLH